MVKKKPSPILAIIYVGLYIAGALVLYTSGVMHLGGWALIALGYGLTRAESA